MFDFSDLAERETPYSRIAADTAIKRAVRRFTLAKCGADTEPVDFRDISRGMIARVEMTRPVEKSRLNF